MSMSSVELPVDEIVDVLRDEGSDIADIEAKRARDGYPQDLAPTLSAFGNLPGGGVVALGLDERDGFSATGVYDPVDAKKRLAAQARDAVKPPLTVELDSGEVDGQTVVLARVAPLPAPDKPCVVRSSGRAYMRSYDGDYPLSEQEVAAFVAERGTPRYDRESVDGSCVDDLDPELLSTYLRTVRGRSPRLSAMTDPDVLGQTRIVTPDGELTLGGLYALGSYPQRLVPTLAISARVAAHPSDPEGTRSSDLAHFDGPLPELLDQALAWVRRNTATRVRFGPDGQGRDEPTYPTEAVRELVANALVHRDLGAHALGDRVQLVLEADRLVLTNPGGLFGLTVEQLGVRVGGSARNQSLYDIVKDVRAGDGRRIIEGVGTGIAAARDALRSAGMTPPYFLDAGVRFTALVPRHALLDPDDISWVTSLSDSDGMSDTQRHALVAMRHGTTWTNRSFRDQFPMDSTRARALLTDLVARGLARTHGERGSRSYTLDPATLAAGDASDAVSVDDRPLELAVHDATAAEAHGDRPGLTAEGLAELDAARITRNGGRVVAALRAGPATVDEIVRATDLTERQVAFALRKLREGAYVLTYGGQGIRGTRYGWHVPGRGDGS